MYFLYLNFRLSLGTEKKFLILIFTWILKIFQKCSHSKDSYSFMVYFYTTHSPSLTPVLCSFSRRNPGPAKISWRRRLERAVRRERDQRKVSHHFRILETRTWKSRFQGIRRHIGNLERWTRPSTAEWKSADWTGRIQCGYCQFEVK